MADDMTKPTYDEIVEALETALDELDWAGNRASDFAYPQFPFMCGREDAARKYVEARAIVARARGAEHG